MADEDISILKAQHEVLAAVHSRISGQIVSLCEEHTNLRSTWWGGPTQRHREIMGEVRGLQVAAQLAYQMATAKAQILAQAVKVTAIRTEKI